ncbi:hypothetical protein VNI00_016352 [Paramarasmius palmivorus]|uniref:BTB domain-containing protein n=1 Tax=Paramarasmius palmivorus TaxID=297713 RepID=A0AAW0BF80_9AGAR
MSATSSSVPATPPTIERCLVAECSIPIDLILESADGKWFGAHTKNMETFNTAFPPTSSVTHDINDIVKLSETSDVLALLLQFSHYQEHGDLCDKGLDLVLGLATAADKYGNFFAAMVVREAINYYGRQSKYNAVRVIPYKAIHSDFKHMDEIVRSTMDLPLSTALHFMKPYPEVFYAYALYREGRGNEWGSWRDGEGEFGWISYVKRAANPPVDPDVYGNS